MAVDIPWKSTRGHMKTQKSSEIWAFCDIWKNERLWKIRTNKERSWKIYVWPQNTFLGDCHSSGSFITRHPSDSRLVERCGLRWRNRDRLTRITWWILWFIYIYMSMYIYIYIYTICIYIHTIYTHTTYIYIYTIYVYIYTLYIYISPYVGFIKPT